mmetsp:Transcript_5472/g.10425  ORF Transcript_5472/g.10425 Transcript_5472/m.10425 type:complete len:83 (+) Transcript_5472:1037-1285(+)
MMNFSYLRIFQYQFSSKCVMAIIPAFCILLPPAIKLSVPALAFAIVLMNLPCAHGGSCDLRINNFLISSFAMTRILFKRRTS